ncbi:MAG: XrtA-associated tyrosine autokinase [Burkholderiaceae bacterium]
MSVIERAALRLETLQKTGIEVPWRQEQAAPQPVPTVTEPDAAPAPQPVAVERARVVRPPVQTAPAAPRIDIFSPAFVATKKRAEVDAARLTAMGYLVAGQDVRSRLAEEFRIVKRPLLHNAADSSVRRGNVIMVTSSVAGEGKTFASINLAMSIATELERQVVLVEADSARPAVLERLGIGSDRPGLMDALANPALAINDLVVPTNLAQLAVVPAGKASAHATELVASERMSGFIAQLSEEWPNRIVILDAPPLLQTTDARELAVHAGQIVLVVESGRTKQAQVKQALAMLERCPVVMSMLNKSPFSKGNEEYGYYAY